MARPAWWVAGEVAAMVGGGNAPQTADEAYKVAGTMAAPLGAVQYSELGFSGRAAAAAGVA